MPKARPPFDTPRYESLKAQGLSQRAIAEQMGMPEATLRNNLKVLAQAVARTAEEGIPIGDQGLPIQEHSEAHLGNPEVSHIGPP
jgi:predicted transcriptional regulator